MTTQIRNDQMVDLLRPDFIGRNEPNYYLSGVDSLYQALPNLRGFWPMSSVDEGGDVYDLSAQARTLTNTNTATFGATDFLPYVEFNGSNNYLVRSDEAGLDITGSITFGCWVRFDDAAGSNEILMAKYLATGNQRAYRLYRQTDGTIRLIISTDGTALFNTVTTDTPSQNIWYFICAKFTASTSGKVFINDDITTNTTSVPASIFNSNANFRISSDDGGSGFVDGRIALPFLCAGAVDDSLIGNLYQQTRVLFDNQ